MPGGNPARDRDVVLRPMLPFPQPEPEVCHACGQPLPDRVPPQEVDSRVEHAGGPSHARPESTRVDNRYRHRLDDDDERSISSSSSSIVESSRVDSALASRLAEYWEIADAELVLWRYGSHLVRAVDASLTQGLETGRVRVARSRAGLFMRSLYNAWRQAGSPPLNPPNEFTPPAEPPPPEDPYMAAYKAQKAREAANRDPIAEPPGSSPGAPANTTPTNRRRGRRRRAKGA